MFQLCIMRALAEFSLPAGNPGRQKRGMSPGLIVAAAICSFLVFLGAPPRAMAQRVTITPSEITVFIGSDPVEIQVSGLGIEKILKFELRDATTKDAIPGLSITRVSQRGSKRTLASSTITLSLRAESKARPGRFVALLRGGQKTLGKITINITEKTDSRTLRPGIQGPVMDSQIDVPQPAITAVDAFMTGYIIRGRNFTKPNGDPQNRFQITENDTVVPASDITSLSSTEIFIKDHWTQGTNSFRVSHQGGQKTATATHTRPEITRVELTDAGYVIHGINLSDGGATRVLFDNYLGIPETNEDVTSCADTSSPSRVEITISDCNPALWRNGNHTHMVRVGRVESRPYVYNHLAPRLDEIETWIDGYQLIGAFGNDAGRITVIEINAEAGSTDAPVEAPFELLSSNRLHVQRIPDIAIIRHQVLIDQRRTISRYKSHSFPPVIRDITFGDNSWTITGIHLAGSGNTEIHYNIDGAPYDKRSTPLDPDFPKAAWSDDGRTIVVSDILPEGPHTHHLINYYYGYSTDNDHRTIDHPPVNFEAVEPFSLESSSDMLLGGTRENLIIQPAISQPFIKFLETSATSRSGPHNLSFDLTNYPTFTAMNFVVPGDEFYGPLTVTVTAGPIQAEKTLYISPENPPVATGMSGGFRDVDGKWYVTKGDELRISTTGSRFDVTRGAIGVGTLYRHLPATVLDDAGQLTLNVPDLDGENSSELKTIITAYGDWLGFPVTTENIQGGLNESYGAYFSYLDPPSGNVHYFSRPAFHSCGHDVPAAYATPELLAGFQIVPGVDFNIRGDNLLLPYEQQPGELTSVRMIAGGDYLYQLDELDAVSSTELEIQSQSTPGKLTVRLPVSVLQADPRLFGGMIYVSNGRRLSRQGPGGYESSIRAMSNMCSPQVLGPTMDRPTPNPVRSTFRGDIEISGRYLGWLATKVTLNGVEAEIRERHKDFIVVRFDRNIATGEFVVETQAGPATYTVPDVTMRVSDGEGNLVLP